jgi:hypothetical protein
MRENYNAIDIDKLLEIAKDYNLEPLDVLNICKKVEEVSIYTTKPRPLPIHEVDAQNVVDFKNEINNSLFIKEILYEIRSEIPNNTADKVNYIGILIHLYNEKMRLLYKKYNIKDSKAYIISSQKELGL